MKKRMLALLAALTLLIAFPSCEEGEEKKSISKGSAASLVEEEEAFTATDAYDLYSEAIVNLMEAEAYDISMLADVETGGSTLAINMSHQFSDDGETCAYYSHQDMAGMMVSDTYYGDGLLTEIHKSLFGDGTTVTQTEMDRETFLAENNTTANIGGIDIPAESFEEAEILVTDETVTVTIVYRNITQVPPEFETYVGLLVDTETATDLTYADTTIRLEMTTEGELIAIWIESGLSYIDGEGQTVAVKLDADVTVNATGDDVVVTPFTEDRLPDESETGENGEEGAFGLGNLMGSGSFEIPEEYRDMIPEEYLQYLS